jgi:hypothetical protein
MTFGLSGKGVMMGWFFDQTWIDVELLRPGSHDSIREILC